MPRTRPPYPPEFRKQMVEMVRMGRTAEELSREFGADGDDDPEVGPTGRPG